MEPVSAGQVVFLLFPYSDLSHNKLRPAVILAAAGNDDWIACQITSKRYADPLAIELSPRDFAQGGLHQVSFVRPGKLFTANSGLFHRVAGQLYPAQLERVLEAVIRLLSSSGRG